MRRRHLIGGLGLAGIACASCGWHGGGPAMVLAGGTAIDPGSSAISDSLILIAGGRIESIAPRGDAASGGARGIWNISEKFVIPGPVELRQGVRMPGFGSIAEAQTAMIKPPEAVEGIVSDTDGLPRELLSALARAETIVVPRLARLLEWPDKLVRGSRNVKALLDAGIRIASFGEAGSLTEWKLLTQTGLSPAQMLASATIHAARVTRWQESAGSLRPGYVANLWVLRRDPQLSAKNLGAVESIMAEGEWVK